MDKTLLARISLVALVVGLTACGSDQPAPLADQPPATSPAAVTTEASPDDADEVTPGPARRAPIVVEGPQPGDTVTSPVTVEGTANVFEATVSIRILDESGEILTETFTTATCGSGCRGTFSEAVAFEVDHEQPGTIMVFESSAEDGRPIHVVRVAVTLSP